jgi:hypothetical protein
MSRHEYPNRSGEMTKTFHYGNWEYTKDRVNNHITITRYTGGDMEITVPAQIDKMNVDGFYPFIFSEAPAKINVKHVVFSEGIQTIGIMALASSSIQEVVLSSTIQSVDSLGFSESIQRVTVNPNNPLFFDIDGVLFKRENENRHLVFFPSGRTTDTYKVPDGTTHIDRETFFLNKNLEQIIIPDSVISIDSLVFENCLKLRSVRLSPNIKILRATTFSDCTALSDVRVSRKIDVISPDAFKDCPEFKEISIQTRMSAKER